VFVAVADASTSRVRPRRSISHNRRPALQRGSSLRHQSVPARREGHRTDRGSPFSSLSLTPFWPARKQRNWFSLRSVANRDTRHIPPCLSRDRYPPDDWPHRAGGQCCSRGHRRNWASKVRSRIRCWWASQPPATARRSRARIIRGRSVVSNAGTGLRQPKGVARAWLRHQGDVRGGDSEVRRSVGIA
jgi:hypothetical protein